MVRATFVLLIVGGLTASAIRGESPQVAPPGPTFEVASVKPNTQGTNFVQMGAQGNRYSAINVPISLLIRQAYQVQEDQIVGGPGWLNTDRYDIVATGELRAGTGAGPLGPNPLPLMLRALLADRFKLAVHTETRDLPVYALIMARSDGRLGPQLKRVEGDCTTRQRPPGCGTTIGPGVLLAYGQTMAQLARAFSQLSNTGMPLSRNIIDRTGLSGLFDADLRFTPSQIPNLGPGAAPCVSAPPPPGSAAGGAGPCLPAIDPNGPSIFTAVQEQLGLKLDAQRGPVEVIVIDRVERPTAD